MTDQIEELTDEQEQAIEEILEVVENRGGMEHFIDRLEGRSGGLRPSKPQASGDTGLEQYVWRMARFHSGDDTSMPITASWWLEEFLEDREIEGSVSGIVDDRGKAITRTLDVLTSAVLGKLGRSDMTAAKRWGRILGFADDEHSDASPIG